MEEKLRPLTPEAQKYHDEVFMPKVISELERMNMKLIPASFETKLYDSPGIFRALNPPPEPLMTVRIDGMPGWRFKLNSTMTFEEWRKKKSRTGHSIQRLWAEKDDAYEHRLQGIYAKYLRAQFNKAGTAVRAFMKATRPILKKEEAKHALPAPRRKRKQVPVVDDGLPEPASSTGSETSLRKDEPEA